MRLFLLCLALLAATPSHARWSVESEFQLQLSESLFDKVVEDFWHSLQGQQNILIGNLTVSPGGIPIRIEGIRAELDYAFPLPERVERQREWSLATENLSASLFVDKISATQTIEREIDGIIIVIRLNAECRNVRLRLPSGNARAAARVRANVVASQVQLTLPHFEAEWRKGSWEVVSMNCSGAQGFDTIVAREALKALSTFQNFDREVRSSLLTHFEKWSKDASLLLLSERELPSKKDYLKIFYEPESAVDNEHGLLLAGRLRFEYPYVAQGQEIEHFFPLDSRVAAPTSASPILLLPFATVRALLMGEYFAGRLENSVWSDELEGFRELMSSRWTQFFIWPHLMQWHKKTKFAFQFLPMGPPSFTEESAAGDGHIAGRLSLPLSVRMYAPLSGVYTPMVEFRTMLSGSANLSLSADGKIRLATEAEEYPVYYGWARKYLRDFGPSEHIAVETIAREIRKSLGQEGFSLSLPELTVGKALMLKPEKWNLEGETLRIHFDVKK